MITSALKSPEGVMRGKVIAKTAAIKRETFKMEKEKLLKRQHKNTCDSILLPKIIEIRGNIEPTRWDPKPTN